MRGYIAIFGGCPFCFTDYCGPQGLRANVSVLDISQSIGSLFVLYGPDSLAGLERIVSSEFEIQLLPAPML